MSICMMGIMTSPNVCLLMKRNTLLRISGQRPRSILCHKLILSLDQERRVAAWVVLLFSQDVYKGAARGERRPVE